MRHVTLSGRHRSPCVVITPESLPSKNQLKLAGDRIRRRMTGAFVLDGEQAATDTALVNQWRVAHTDALVKTRQLLGTVVSDALELDSSRDVVVQRLKTYKSVVRKLVRDRTRLAEIDDIAGCRAVLPNIRDVELVRIDLERRARRMAIERVRDYNATPHAGGYRALHLCCRRDGFKVEIQLRTFNQHEWAKMVEEWDDLLGLDIKHENAPAPVLTYFREWANYWRRIDSGVQHSDTDATLLNSATAGIRRWLAEEVRS